ncbi:matrix metalloproteinase-17 isoform X1 [Canis lupus baileyi]|uniref:matrix metalloproteinase-17 isoform X1 n=1 Tax=Canis lupus baileyi TaxID=143281 RepID=UPI003B96A88C
MGRRAAPGPGPPPPWPRPRLPPLPWLLLALATRGGWGAPAPRAEDLSLGVEWLSRFGYLPPADSTTGQLQTQEELSKAIAAMQRFGGLEATGILDVATLALMKTPRCSLPDLPAAAPARRRRQAPAPTTWHKRSLSWRVRTFPRDSPLGPDTVRALMHYALKVWSDITPLNFHEVAGSAADIQIDFSKADHNDAYPFDGPGGTVAHAFFPGDHHTAGDAHFDDDESWAFRSSDAHDMDLFAVAVHEFGHAIGLSHVAATSSIMQPYYQGPVGDPLHYRLPYEDRVRIWQLYGVRESVSPTAQPDTPEPKEPPLLPEPPNNRSSTLPRKDVPHRCSTDFDAVAQIRGEAFFFKGKYFWRLTRDGHLVSLQPAQMHRFWRGLPLQLDSVDAVYERTSDHKIVFFKGHHSTLHTLHCSCTGPEETLPALGELAGCGACSRRQSGAEPCRTSCTGALMSTHGAWTPATPPAAPRGGASPARSMTPCAGPTVLLTSSAARSTGKCWTASWRWRPGTHSPQRGTGWSAETCRQTQRVQAEKLGPTPGRDSTARAAQRTVSRSAPALPLPLLPQRPQARCWQPHCYCPRAPCGQWPGPWCSDSRWHVRPTAGASQDKNKCSCPSSAVATPVRDPGFLQQHTQPCRGHTAISEQTAWSCPPQAGERPAEDAAI